VDFDWNSVLELVEYGQTAPVIGKQLLVAVENDEPPPVSKKRLSRWPAVYVSKHRLNQVSRAWLMLTLDPTGIASW
jgi:hypothetical protein